MDVVIFTEARSQQSFTKELTTSLTIIGIATIWLFIKIFHHINSKFTHDISIFH